MEIRFAILFNEIFANLQKDFANFLRDFANLQKVLQIYETDLANCKKMKSLKSKFVFCKHCSK